MGYPATAKHAKDRSRHRVRLKLPVLPFRPNDDIISCIHISDISNIFLIDLKDFPNFYEKIPNYKYFKHNSIFVIFTVLPPNISVPNDIQNRIDYEYVNKSKNSKHDISVAILIKKIRLMCLKKNINVMSRSKLMLTSEFIDKQVINYMHSSIVVPVNQKNPEIVKPGRKHRNFYKGEFTLHPVEKSWGKKIFEMIGEIVDKNNVRMIHLIDMDNVKLAQNQKNGMMKRKELPLIIRNHKKNVIYKPITAENSIYDAIFVTNLMMSHEIYICKNQNFNLYFGFVENYFAKKSKMHDTLPKNFSRNIIFEYVESLQKLFLGKELRQLSQGDVKLGNISRKMFTSIEFNNTKKQTSIVISLECCMVMRMGKDKVLHYFPEEVKFNLTFYKRENNWEINFLADERFSAESFNFHIKQFHLRNNNQKRKRTDFTNNKLTPFQNVPLVHDDFPIIPPKQILQNSKVTYINQEVNAVPVENIGINAPHEENPCIYMPQNTTRSDSDHQKLRPLYITVPVIDDCADVLMIYFMTLLDFKLPEEIDFLIVSKDNIFKSAVSILSRTKKGSRKIMVQENFD